MSVFSNLKTDGLEQAQDRLGGFQAIPSDAYIGTIKAAYAGKAAASNAQSVTIIVDFPTGEYRETIWITNKNGENFFLNKSDNSKKVPLPGFTIINDICLIAAGKPLSDMATEEKVMNVYDSDQKKEIPKAVPMITELIGQKIGLAILREISFKQEKNSSGDYIDTDEIRNQNLTDKVFHPELMLTVVEATNNITEADFIPKWTEKNKGIDRDKTKNKSGNAPKSGKPGSVPQSSGNTSKPTSSLFNKS